MTEDQKNQLVGCAAFGAQAVSVETKNAGGSSRAGG